jgi:dipeptidase D
MILQVIDIFKTLCGIAHCSGECEAMRGYLESYGRRCGYAVSTDHAGNILCETEGASVTLQAHYDMVCIGNAPQFEIVEKEGWLQAENSTLGADNGIGMAMMLALMEQGAVADFIFTADEEIGLVGARNLEVMPKAPFLLNLDSEEEGVVTIGCAGGVDIEARLRVERERKELYCCEVQISGLPGGHSGVDIDRNIPNAIKELAAILASKEDIELVDFQGGERRNAIPKHSVAVIASENPITIEGAKQTGRKKVEVIRNGEAVITMLDRFVHGVKDYDDALGIVRTSINLAQVYSNNREITVHLSARSMQKARLEALERETMDYFAAYGCKVSANGFYAPWNPEKTMFSRKVLNVTRTLYPGASFGAIHAGLECGIIKAKFPGIEMASIGPTILYPHSTRERVEIASVLAVYEIVRKIIAAV